MSRLFPCWKLTGSTVRTAEHALMMEGSGFAVKINRGLPSAAQTLPKEFLVVCSKRSPAINPPGDKIQTHFSTQNHSLDQPDRYKLIIGAKISEACLTEWSMSCALFATFFDVVFGPHSFRYSISYEEYTVGFYFD
ncbi:hypothetical protein ES703_59445 [subsurface metagenome]